jgi:DNA polymerase III alpha subunit
MAIADRPTGRGQLCYNITSKKKIERFIEKLENPPFKLDDNCRLIANWEREYIGREMTCTELDMPGVHDSYNCINCQFVENLNGAENTLYNLPLIVKSFNEFKTKSGGKMCFLRGYDISGSANNIGVFSDVYYKFRKCIYTGNKLLLRGSFSKDIFIVREIIEI